MSVWYWDRWTWTSGEPRRSLDSQSTPWLALLCCHPRLVTPLPQLSGAVVLGTSGWLARPGAGPRQALAALAQWANNWRHRAAGLASGGSQLRRALPASGHTEWRGTPLSPSAGGLVCVFSRVSAAVLGGPHVLLDWTPPTTPNFWPAPQRAPGPFTECPSALPEREG